MKKQMLSLFLALALTGCAAPGPGSTSAPAESGAAPAGSEAPASASQEESGYDRREAIERPEIGAEVVIDPPYDFDPAEMVPGDFGDYFTDCDYPTQVSTYKLAEGTDIENEVTVLQGEEEGPTIYIVAGVHGDEIAGWMTGNLVKKIGIRAGTVHILRGIWPSGWPTPSTRTSRGWTRCSSLTCTRPGPTRRTKISWAVR